MKLLVTGAAGFIGSNFVHYWTDKYPNDEIGVIDSLTYAGNIENLKSVINKIKFYEADINNHTKVSEAMAGVDAVVHFAAESHVDRSIFDPESYWHSNVNGTKVLLEEAKKAGVPRFHHISTDEVYGELPLESDLKFTEKTPYAPRNDNLYALTKAESDRIVLDFAKESDMHITISNCSNNYGPYQFPEKFIPIIVTNLIDKIKIPLHGDGRNVRDWIHTQDHSSAIDLILQKGKRGETYLVGTNNDRSNGFIAEKIIGIYGADKSAINNVSDRHSNDRRYAIDATKLITELGWKPKISRDDFEDALKDTVEWYKNNQDWWRPLLKRKAEISDKSGRVKAYISLDRESGKTKFAFEELQLPNDSKSSNVIEKDFAEEYKIRRDIVLKNLNSKKWYQNSSDVIKDKILTLSKDQSTFGYVEDLSQREDVLSGDTILELVKVEHAEKEFGIYGIASWFKVKDGKGDARMEGYYSWGWGPKSGAKLLVFLKSDGKESHVALQRESKFPTARVEYSLAGGFPKLNESVLDFIIRSLDCDLGFNIFDADIKIVEIKSLGRVNTDSGMTNNKPNLYSVTIEIPRVEKESDDQNGSGVVIWPIEKITDLINMSDDAYLLSALSRLGIYLNK